MSSLSWWERFRAAVFADRSLARSDDTAFSEEELRPERPGEEPPILTSPASMGQLMLALILAYTGTILLMWDFNTLLGVGVAFVGIAIFFHWCNRYPLRVIMSSRDDIVAKLRRKERYSRDQAAEVLNSRFGEGFRRLALARVIRAKHDLRHAFFFCTDEELILLPVEFEHLGARAYRLYRHDELRQFPLEAIDLTVLDDKSFRRRYPGIRPRHNPSYLPLFFILRIEDAGRKYRLILQFEVGTLPETIEEALQPGTEGGRPGRRPDAEADPLLEKWHVSA